ncbi:PREDICTED: protein takeout-like [Nicrophorus vespilloides]|uniref:Protein takeout-like n=1 Tax=Nicrophorus vespilloides TaxID=110193 RepID=A0ABM1MV52_NICVS|nr:PREDICTED: protein takeout-like [Nicrophorus vespilloides]
MNSVTRGLILLVLTFAANAAKLPSFIQKCDKNDPNFGKCAIDLAHDIIPKLQNGYKELNFPPFVPFHVQEIAIEATDSLKLKLSDVDIFGLEKAKFNSIDCNFNSMDCVSKIYFPELEVKGIYDIDGRVMILPIKGHGPTNIKIVGGNFLISFKWSIKQKEGVDYASIGKFELHYQTERSIFHFDNLFNGDKVLGDQMNDFLNENWQELSREVEPAVSNTIAVILKSIFSKFADQIPYNELFL